MHLTKGAAENTKPGARNPKVKAKRNQQQDNKTAAKKMQKQWQKNVNTVAKEI